MSTNLPEIDDLPGLADAKDEQKLRSSPTTGLGSPRNRFFLYTAIAMLVVVALGFGRSFYLRPVFIDRPLPTYLIAHGAVMTAWYLLFLAQTVLVYRGRVDMHRKLGVAGLLLAFAVVATALQVQLNAVPRMISLGMVSSAEDLSRAIGFALSSMSSLVPFVILVALAVLLRRKSAIHKRLMFWAMVWTIGPAFAEGRPLGQMLDPMVQPHLPFFPSDLLWLTALLAYDWMSEKRIHRVTWIGFVVLAFYAVIVQEWVATLDGLHDWMRAYVHTRS